MFKQFVRFGIVGAINAVLNYIIYVICIKCGMHYVAANIIGFVIVIFIAFLLQNRFVFSTSSEEPQQKWWITLLKTYISYILTGIILTNVFSWLWIDILDLSALLYPLYAYAGTYCNWISPAEFAKYCAPVLNCVIMIPINFLINKFWTYKQCFQ